MSKTDMGIRTVFADDRATARQLLKAKLVVLEGADEGKEFEIGKSKVYAGRASVNDIILKDKSISSTHFEIRAEEDGFLLRDCGSTNGTRLGGCRVKQIYLEPNASFRAGNTTIKLEPVDEVVEIPLSDEEHFEGVIGRSVAMREIFATLEKVAPSELTCLIEGQTGTGKERIARAIHDASRRRNKPYVVLDCSSIPRDLMESYVFGHEKGAFTGAHEKREGAFEQAEGGTLFLDEVGELDLALQPKLLRVLENREFKRVGGARTLRSDCRVVAATNRDLRQMVNEGSFREDLYFRLSVIQLHLTPLAQRPDDIPLLVDHFLEDVAQHRPDKQKVRLTADAMDSLMGHPWPGNVRELKNVIVRAASLCSGNTVERSDLQVGGPALSNARASSPARSLSAGSLGPTPADGPGPGADVASFTVDLSRDYKGAKADLLDQFEHAYLERIYAENDGNISQSAREAGITRYHMREMLKKHELK